MVPLNRRRFLRLVSTGAGSLVLPFWRSEASADVDVENPASTLTPATLSVAYEEAQRLGKPLLVIVVPDEVASEPPTSVFPPVNAPTRSLVEGIVGGDVALAADLALAHVGCARLSDLRAVIPSAPGGSALVLIETEVVPSRAVAVNVSLPTAAEENFFDQRTIEAEIDTRVRAVAGAIHAALLPNRATLVRRASVARRNADPSVLARVAKQLAERAPIEPKTADQVAAVVALAADRAGQKVRTDLRRQLAAGALARLRDHDVPGSVWGTYLGCGRCGMGYLSARDEKFLYFYARPGYRFGL